MRSECGETMSSGRARTSSVDGASKFYMEGPSALDTKPDVAGREAGFNVSLRVEAELDLNDPKVFKTMSQLGLITVSEI